MFKYIHKKVILSIYIWMVLIIITFLCMYMSIKLKAKSMTPPVMKLTEVDISGFKLISDASTS